MGLNGVRILRGTKACMAQQSPRVAGLRKNKHHFAIGSKETSKLPPLFEGGTDLDNRPPDKQHPPVTCMNNIA